ncbi:MAG: heme o synthase [Alphaproteobacteria bacterium]
MAENQSFTKNNYTTSDHYETEIKDYISLLKPRVMSLVIFTGFTGMYLAPGNIHPLLAFISILCIALGSGAAGAINMWYDRDIDQIMSRTKNRPIPTGKINPTNALEFALIVAIASVFIMAVFINFLSAFFLLSAILFYVFIYTIWLKRRTPQNIVIGGAAGAFPPIIGWCAVTNSLTIEPIMLFLIIFLWTPPHFWALSLYKSSDYKKANIPMLPVVAGEDETRKQILIYSIIMGIFTILFGFYLNKGALYLISTILLNIQFLQLAFVIWFRKNNIYAPKLFGYSIIYLFVLFSMLILDKLFYYPIFS